MSFLVPLLRAVALGTLLSVILANGSTAQQPKATATVVATATTPPTNDVRCELHVVNNLIKECCSQVGTYLAGYRNCTDFRKTFDSLCKKSFGRSRCRSVTIWCPHGTGHALNLVQMSDGKWYLVEPQGWVWDDYPLPSPELPDSALAALMPGCGCHSEVTEWSPTPNTDPFKCARNEAFLASDSTNPSSRKELCLACCEKTELPPNHPTPADFRRTCASACSDKLDLPGDTYCPMTYTGRACEECCYNFHSDPKGSRPKNACETACKPGEDQWGTIPAETPTYCANKTKSKDECYRCCTTQQGQCFYPGSFACAGWQHECSGECFERFPEQPIATPTIAANSSSSAASKR